MPFQEMCQLGLSLDSYRNLGETFSFTPLRRFLDDSSKACHPQLLLLILQKLRTFAFALGSFPIRH